jgi:UDP-N-acetylmuramoyl-tripeptide--D-alanyl-D-alanine ligase
MIPLTVQMVAEFCEGRLIKGDAQRICRSVSTDSRKLVAGQLFIALVGEKFDGHDFVNQASQAAATAVLVSNLPADTGALSCEVIEVPDTLVALQKLAARHRQLLKPLIVGITGSNGKTSTKDLTLAVLRKKYEAMATAGNLNNHIGVPLTLLSMEEQHNCGVVEMGMNHPGEIAPLAEIARPDAAIITNIGIAHIEYMGSREAIALEKGTLAEAVNPGGVVVLNANDEFTPAIAARCKARVITAGVNAGEVRATIHESGAQGTRFTLDFGGTAQVQIQLAVPGEHMVGNAALAAACAWHHGVSPDEIAAALGAASLTKGRLQVKSWHGVVFLDDSYNANPDSMKAGLKTLQSMQVKGRRVAVLGRMGELGPHAEQGHREVGEFAARCGMGAVYTVGPEAALISNAFTASGGAGESRNFTSHGECAEHLRAWLQEGDAVLLKGSRSTAMEQVLNHLETSP